MKQVDVVILGAGAAGLFCAGTAVARGRKVVVIDHAKAPGEKIRISGGGRCNFTNLATVPDRFISGNMRFAASALARFQPQEFVALVDAAGIAWHEKTAGQLFCDGSSRQIIDMLLKKMNGAELRLGTVIESILPDGEGFGIKTSSGTVCAGSVVVATGGKSIPKMGATPFGYQLAEQYGLPVTETRPGLVPLTFAQQDLDLCKPMAGVSVPARVTHGKTRFDDALLFTHRGLSGPAILQISSYWTEGEQIEVDLCSGTDIAETLRSMRQQGGRGAVASALRRHLPDRLADAIAMETGFEGKRLADQPNNRLDELGHRINAWLIRPVGSEGYRTAEVTVGGVDTRALDARTMQAKAVPGLYFIGEVVDVTGWLGGYNFQWAWASGHAAGQVV